MSMHSILAGLAALPCRHPAQHAWHSLAVSANLMSKSSSILRCSVLDQQQLQGEGSQQGTGSSAQLACPGDGSRLLSSLHASTSSRCSYAMHHHHHQSSRSYASSSAAAPQQAKQHLANSPDTPQHGSLPGWVPFTLNPAVKPRKPEDMVGEKSWLLIHYRRNLPPRQLVHRIAKRTTPQAMLEELKIYQTKIDGIVIAAVVAKLMRMQRYSASYPHADPASVISLMEWLLPFAQFQLRYCNTRTLVALLWAWASITPDTQLRNAWPRDFAAVIVERCTRDRKPGHPHRLSQLSPDRLALLAWSAGRLLGAEPPLLGTPTPDSTSSGVDAGRDTGSSTLSGSGSPGSGSGQHHSGSEERSSVARGHDLAGMASVLSKWGTNWGKDTKETKRGIKRLTWSTKRLEHTSTERLGILAYGLAMLEPKASAEGVQRIAEAAAERAQQVVFSGFTRADCVRLATACAATGVRHPALFASLAAAALPSLKHWPAQDAGAMAASFGAVRIKHEAMLDAAAAAVLRSESPSSFRRGAAGSSARQQRQPFLLPPKYVGGSPDILGLPGLGTDTETTPEAAARAAREVLEACQTLEHSLPPDTVHALATKAKLHNL